MSVGIGCIALGAILRILCTASIAFGDHLNMKEKFFVSLSWMSKATVQAALGPVALKHLSNSSSDELKNYAYIVQTVSVLSILLTAPLGAILISVTGTKLLTKTKQPQITDGMCLFHFLSIIYFPLLSEYPTFLCVLQVGAVVIVLRYVISASLTRKRNVKILNCLRIRKRRIIPNAMLIFQLYPTPIMLNNNLDKQRSQIQIPSFFFSFVSTKWSNGYDDCV